MAEKKEVKVEVVVSQRNKRNSIQPDSDPFMAAPVQKVSDPFNPGPVKNEAFQLFPSADNQSQIIQYQPE